MTSLPSFIDAIKTALTDQSFVRLSLGTYRGDEPDLKKIIVRPITVKGTDKLSFTYRYATRDIVKNYDPADAVTRIEAALGKDFASAALSTTGFELSYPAMARSAPRETSVPAAGHDRAKHRHLVPRGQLYLQRLGITDGRGAVKASAQDKYRQIDKYVELVGGLVTRQPAGAVRRIVDMGSGKGYLTFALYDYLSEKIAGLEVTGVEMRDSLVALCNDLAQACDYHGLGFTTGRIDTFDAAGTDMLVALHACDTATDDAIAKGIAAGAKLIVVAPCCHKQIRGEMTRGQVDPRLSFMLRHGSFLERQAEMVTDAMRALVLEYFGYSVKAFEFISDAHTPKNIMIVAEKKRAARSPEMVDKLSAAKSLFGIDTHYLEITTGISRGNNLRLSE